MSLTNAQLKEQIFARSSKSQARMPRVSVLLSYAAVFTLIISVVAIGYRAPQESQLANASTGATNANMTGAINLDKPSVDELVATDIAANLAESTNMPVAAQVAELSSSLSAKIDLAQTSDTRIDKPQITELISGGKAIAVYKAQAGDTASSVATAHGLTPDTIKWANGLASDAIEAGRDLLIPPVDGVVYTLKAGDTADSLAGTYKADKNRIESFNNVSVEGFNPGQRIVIPGGVLPAEQVPGYQPPSVNRGNTAQSFGGNSGYRVNSGIASASAGNRYAFGNCTWYAYERRAQLGRPVGSFWGNASSWGIYARSAGFTVNNQPAAGAVLVERSGYYGHVGVVETVNGDGSIVISEMNNYAYGGFNIVNKRTISAGQAGSYTYIH